MFWQSGEELEAEKRKHATSQPCSARQISRTESAGVCLPLIADFPQNTTEKAKAEIHAFMTNSWKWVDPMTGWTRVRAVVDSGASDACAPKDMAPLVESQESAGSKRGLTYSGAAPGGKALTNDGEKQLLMVTNEGTTLGTCWQTVEVARPLLSVRQIAQQGNRVTFWSYRRRDHESEDGEGGAIWNGRQCLCA